MIPEIRTNINAEYTESKYNDFVHELNSTYKYPTDFRAAETPIFLPRELRNHLVAACDDILEQIQTQEYIRHSSSAVPSNISVPNETDHPAFIQIDFGICKDANGNLLPQLIELQGFPSLYGYQAFLNDTIRKHFSIPPTFGASFNGFVRETYEELLRSVIVGTKDPSNVVLLEIEPEKQKTRIDFAVMEKMLGIRTVCLTKIIKRGKELYYNDSGNNIRIDRIYNRVIVDELERSGIRSAFHFNDDVHVEWAGHPHWYFKLSKHTLPFLKGRYVPECSFVTDHAYDDNNLHNTVLKPLFSFAGLGVDIDVTKQKLASLHHPHNYILQRKVEYADVIKTPDGFSKAEIRMMIIWDTKPVLVKNLVRLSQGKMMGVDFNRNKRWVGSTIAYHEAI